MGRVVYVRGFPATFTNDELKAHFRQFGHIKNVRVVSDNKKLFGIVTFFGEVHAKAAIESLNGNEFERSNLYVAECEKSSERNSAKNKEQAKQKSRPKTLYLRYLPAHVSEEKLREIFAKYGNISNVCIQEKVTFLTFHDSKSADSAFEAEKSLKVDGQRVFVNKLMDKRKIVKFIYRKNNRKQAKNSKSNEAKGVDMQIDNT